MMLAVPDLERFLPPRTASGQAFYLLPVPAAPSLQASELLCGGNALLDATTPIRDYFRVADNQGVIVLGLKSKC